MDIPTIKQHLTLSQVVNHYGLRADKQNRLRCPFHNDRTPSLQLYYKTQTCYCFSSNCKTHGKSMDVIDFIMYKENLSKHEAILKAQSMLNISPTLATPNTFKVQPNQSVRTLFLENLFTYFKNAVSNSKPAQEYIKQRGLDYTKTEIGYNSGQFHHGARKDETLINEAIQYGLLLDQGKKSRLGEPAYSPFGKTCICFALRDQENTIVSLYFRSILDNKNSKHYYLRDRQGLYPHYPNKETKKLILCESIIDTATLLEQENVRENYSVLALYGTNGFTDEHKMAISELSKLEEIILFMDGDEAGRQAVEKHSNLFKEYYPNLAISQVETPQGEDINSLLLGHDAEILSHLLKNRKPIPTQEQTLLFSTEKIESIQEPNPISNKNKKDIPLIGKALECPEGSFAVLDTANPYNLKYKTDNVLYQIKGFRCEQLDSLKVTLQIQLK